ncbi:MAG: DUF429 domain-containing protein [Planctomycetota bacterium]
MTIGSIGNIITGESLLVNATPNPTGDEASSVRAMGRCFRKVMGVDFSGAALAGKTAWAAELTPTVPSDDEPASEPAFTLTSLQPLGRLAGSDDRIAVNRYLVDRISDGGETFWGCDFPFGLPIELRLGSWASQLSHVKSFDGDAKELGRSLVERTREQSDRLHIRRTTDRETQTPFDCYHYRIIYQTFHGMRDVLEPLAKRPDVAVLPFQYKKLAEAAAVVVEACPSSTLKKQSLPHQRYKQSGGKPPSSQHQATRREILRWVSRYVEISPYRRRVIQRDSGGDALDAVLAGLGSWLRVCEADHKQIAGHKRYPREGFVYA